MFLIYKRTLHINQTLYSVFFAKNYSEPWEPALSMHCESAADLEVLVVVWADAEAGHKAVDHKVYVSTLAPGAPGEWLSGVEQESLRVHAQKTDVVHMHTHQHTGSFPQLG